MPFLCILTNTGLARFAEAIATNTTVTLAEMAVGDGNGSPTTPSASQTQLVNERFRAEILDMQVDGVNPNKVALDLSVPMTQGGWTIHEVGVFDNLGNLIAVANFPATYKPLPSEGAARDLIVRVYLEVVNVDLVNVVIDPAMVLASRQWVVDNYSLAALIPGGTTGQRLAKASNANGDVHWVDPGVTEIIVDAIHETQTLAAGQVVVNLLTATVTGMAVYIEGVRIFSFTENTSTQFTLGQSYAEGTRIDIVQNDPMQSVAGTTTGKLVRLEDIGGGTAGLPAVRADNLLGTPPPGTVAPFARFTAPAGWFKCDGAAVSRATYDRLFEAVTKTTTGNLASGTNTILSTADTAGVAAGMIVEGVGIPNGTTVSSIAGNTVTLSQNAGTTQVGATIRFFMFGNGNGTNTFNLPDLRGEFVRGWDSGRGIDASHRLGGSQLDALQNITGGLNNVQADVDNTMSASGAFAVSQGNVNGNYLLGGSGGYDATFDASRVARTATETRPRNVSLLYCIRY